jgi:hypothetical protein
VSVLRSLAVVLIIGVVVAALAAYRWTIQDRFKAEDAVSESFRAETAPRVVVETFNGPIEVVAVDEPRVEARVTRRASGSTQETAEEALDEIIVTMNQDGNTVRIAAQRPDQPWSTGNRSAAVHVQVPLNTVLELVTSNGKVVATGLTGDVTMRSSNGELKVKGSRGDLSLTTSNGAIDVDGGRGQLDLRTSNGDIQVKTKDSVVKARSSNGKIRCEGALAAGDHHLQTSNGQIVLTLPASSSFTVDASTTKGKVIDAFRMKQWGKPRTGKLQGQVGENPTMSLKLQTSNGNIDIRKE